MGQLSYLRALLSLVVFAMVTGCGSGLLVEVTATPESASPGQEVTWNVRLQNQTQCSLVDDGDVPPIGDLPPLVLFVGFDPSLQTGEPAAICQALASCNDLSCLENIATETGIGARIESVRDTVEQAARGMARSAATVNGPPIVPPACEVINNDSSGVIGLCIFNNLAPGQSESVNVSDFAPDTGRRRSFQIAFAFAAARGPDCSPGIEVEEDLWSLGGCAAISEPAPAPLLSSAGLALLVAALFLTAALALRQRRNRSH